MTYVYMSMKLRETEENPYSTCSKASKLNLAINDNLEEGFVGGEEGVKIRGGDTYPTSSSYMYNK